MGSSEEEAAPADGGTAAGTRRSLRVDLRKLEMESLQRYQRVFHLPGRADDVRAKESMIPTVSRHFGSAHVDEEDVLLCFPFSLRRQAHHARIVSGVEKKEEARVGPMGGGGAPAQTALRLAGYANGNEPPAKKARASGGRGKTR